MMKIKKSDLDAAIKDAMEAEAERFEKVVYLNHANALVFYSLSASFWILSFFFVLADIVSEHPYAEKAGVISVLVAIALALLGLLTARLTARVYMVRVR